MKKIFSFALILVMLLASGCTNSPKETPLENFEYNINEEKETAGIKKYIGTDTDIVIPKKIEGYPVVSISCLAFSKSDIQSVIIPESVADIYDYAFSCCESLKTVDIRSKELVIHYQVFINCINLENLTLPNGLTEIGGKSFYGCKALKELHIPATLNKWGNAAFCRAQLEKLTFEDGIERIGAEGCFWPGDNLKSVTIPASVKVIGECTFSDKLEEIIFLGDAPKSSSEWPIFFKNTVIIKYKKGTSGWDAPEFEGYTLEEIE